MNLRIVRRAKRWLYIIHRWIGIATCLLFAMWFVSGVVMMYVAFPQLSDTERWAALPPVAWDKVAVTPDRALALTGATTYPRELRLAMLDTTPVYRITTWDGRRAVIAATDGHAIDAITADQALAISAHHPASTRPELLDTVTRDQWSVTARYDPLRPLFLVGLGDAAGTELYVSSRSGEIALDTTRHERIWNWLGSIPHWIYPTVLRKDGAAWRQVVLWISGFCIVVATTGFWIGVLRLRLRQRYARGRMTPYRGWMAWHHLAGLVGGVFVVTWMVSGWLSLNPLELFAGRGIGRDMAVRYMGQDQPRIADIVARPQAGAVEARFVWLGGRPLMLLADRSGHITPADPATGAPLALAETDIVAAARRLLPDAMITLRQRLTQADWYWYSHHQERTLPVLRIGFDDAAHSWFHIAPATGDLLGRSDDSRRAYRWWFNALHSLDLLPLLAHRPAWDIVVWLLSLIGLVVSVSGVVVGWRRLRR
ncbi:PepSY domain-containing protein [Bradyrhizobium sp. 2TAF24]|uniref:PepSY domain-containing protein n=1 Tax=Bradyrhizobium sp. 2TAF24 TaxID=3233011 RepID=UPI003F8E8CD4